MAGRKACKSPVITIQHNIDSQNNGSISANITKSTTIQFQFDLEACNRTHLPQSVTVHIKEKHTVLRISFPNV